MAHILRALLVGLVLVSPGIAAGQDPRPPSASSELDGWTSIKLKGRKFLFATGTSRITRWPASPGAEDGLVELTSRARVFGASAASHVAWSEAGSDRGATRRWLSYTPGKKARLCEILGRETLVVSRFEPKAEDDASPLADWPRTETRRLDLKLRNDGGDCGAVTDTATRLVRLDELVAAGQGCLYLATRRGVGRVAFRVAESRRRELRVEDEDAEAWRRVDLDLVEVVLLPDAAGGSEETVLGMHGRTSLWVDAGSGALVEISGESRKGGGRVTLTLRAYSRTPADRPEIPWPEPPPAVDAGRERP